MTIEETPATLVKTFRSILGYLPSRRRRQFWVLLVCLVFVAVVETATLGSIALFASAMADPDAVLQSKYVAAVKGFFHADYLSQRQGLIVTLSILVMALVVVKNMALFNVHYWGIRFATFVDSFFGEKILAGFMRLPYEWHVYHNSADLVLAVGWRRYFGMQFIYSVLQGLSDSFVILFMLITLLAVEPVISIVCIMFLGGSALFIFRQMRGTLDKISKKFRDEEMSVNRHVTMTLHGVKDVKVFGKEDSFINKYATDVYPLARHEALQRIFTRTPVWILETIGFIALISSICIMAFVVELTSAKITGLMALIAVTAWRALPAIGRILGVLTSLRVALPFVHKGLGYLKEVEAAADRLLPLTDKKIPEFHFKQTLRLDKISFAYSKSKEFVLQDINLVIEKGKTVGIIGASGGGKSTLVDILLGLLHPTKGRVLIDGKQLDGKLRPAWTSMVGCVAQSPFIYDGTLSENVAFGLQGKEIDRDWVLECCRMAAMDFLEDLLQGIDTFVGERGIRLSGGQRQRVAIARALYRRPEVIVFDEATSALDSANEKAIQRTIYDLKGKLTLIIVAHRLSTVEDCDFLVCIDKGKVIKVGSPNIVVPWYADNVEQKRG